MTLDAKSKYNRKITLMEGGQGTVDVYRVLAAFEPLAPEVQHSVKKLLCLGLRGKASHAQDLEEAILSLQKLQARLKDESIPESPSPSQSSIYSDGRPPGM